jgi:L-lactate dehydrogenase complex protein LldG
VSAREDVLARVRAALRDVPRDEEPVAPPYEPVPAPTNGVVDLFVDRVSEYRAVVREARDVPTAVLVVSAEHGAHRLAVPPGLPHTWHTDAMDLVPDHDLSPHELDVLDGALTGCALAIAETGTIILDGGARSGRRALTLVPDLHLCVVERAQIVATVPEAIRALHGARGPFTFVSGPSATSDIELDRVEGVHGPRRLEVLLTG